MRKIELSKELNDAVSTLAFWQGEMTVAPDGYEGAISKKVQEWESEVHDIIEAMEIVDEDDDPFDMHISVKRARKSRIRKTDLKKKRVKRQFRFIDGKTIEEAEVIYRPYKNRAHRDLAFLNFESKKAFRAETLKKDFEDYLSEEAEEGLLSVPADVYDDEDDDGLGYDWDWDYDWDV